MKLLMFIAACTISGVAIDNAQSQPVSAISKGVFTSDQAAKGKAVYKAKCAACHGAQLGGAEMAPALAGGQFLSTWSGQSLGDLAGRIHDTMPANNPGTLSRSDTAAIVSYMLDFSHFPSGEIPLSSDQQVLDQIEIQAAAPR